MKITINYDNVSENDLLIADWGFSCSIENNGRKILFDTGGNGRILLENLNNLNIDPRDYDDIFISHPDFDHIGGLSNILNLNQRAVIHNPVSFRGIKYANEVKYYNEPTQIYENIFTTGELGKREQSLAIRTDKGLVIIIGCGHPGIANIIRSLEEFGRIADSLTSFGKVYAIVGGLHGFSEFNVLENIEKVCPTHCTKYIDKIRQLYPGKFIKGGVGTVIEF
ncbi:MAG: MBL fold metallo-hydrolase [Candidatus Cloacimonas sp. SDB]|nr:MAG: MBL fold metallo-hydrolase [Candidatus Cloacimonas sp. SDB]